MKMAEKIYIKQFDIEILTCMMEQGYKWKAGSIIYDAVGFKKGIKLSRQILWLRTLK